MAIKDCVNSEPVENAYHPQKRAPRWLVFVVAIFVLTVVGVFAFFGFVVYMNTYHGQTRSNPAFQGFKGEWSLDASDSPKDAWGRLVIGSGDRWSLTEWTAATGETRDKGAWRELPDGSFELNSGSRTRIAKFEPGDEWVLYIDGVKYRRIVK